MEERTIRKIPIAKLNRKLNNHLLNADERMLLMQYEILVALYVTDDNLYQKYREEMMPILKRYGGGFGYDFKVSDVLQAEVSTPINRVFTIFFESEGSMNTFFSNEDYLKIKQKYFDKSVSSTTIISRYLKQ